MTPINYINGIIGLKKFYRIIPVKHAFEVKYAISTWRWFWPFWLHSEYSWDNFDTKEDAEKHLVELQEAEVYYTL